MLKRVQHDEATTLIAPIKQWLKSRWPRVRLRTVLFATLFTVAAMPGIGAVFLRVYENTLVRQTEAELVAQATVLAATAALEWPGSTPQPLPPSTEFAPEPPRVDLSATPILPARPDPRYAGPPASAANATARRLAPVLAQTRRVTLATPFLLDAAGRVAAGPLVGGSYADLPEVREALAGRSATVLRRSSAYRPVYWFEWLSRAAAIRVHHTRPVVVDGEVVGVILVSRSARALFRGIYEDRGKIALGIATIFAALLALTTLLSRSIARPVEALSAATRDVATGRGIVPPPPPTAAAEIQDLYRDFAVMAAAIDRRSRYLRDFAHAVSHEFKTPLAGIRGALELLREHDMTATERTRFLTNADADAGRLQLLVTRLLELARADMMLAPSDAATDLRAVLATVADSHRSDAFDVEIAMGDLPAVAAPAAMLERLLTTLIENARQAGATGIGFFASEKNDTIDLLVSDNGHGIATADRERIFEPFFTTKRDSGGSGLGLSIVRSMLEAIGGDIALSPSERGAYFTLTLPVRR